VAKAKSEGERRRIDPSPEPPERNHQRGTARADDSQPLSANPSDGKKPS
jgi:hypothetical protein